jgi:acetylornithine/succinyldiaminopimelate/putrescine aminotransferase/predicted amino acid dehydrogenase
MLMSSTYEQYVKPRLAKTLRAIGLDVHFERASGNYIYYRDEQGSEHEVLDFLGGYGATLLGHNPPEILDAAREMLDNEIAVHAQFSLRGRSGDLAAELNRIVRRESGSDCDFVTTFANTGAEAIEVGIKHAEMARVLRLEELLDEITVNIDRVREAIRRGEVEIPEKLYESTDMRDWVFDVRNFDELIVPLVNYNSKELAKRPIFVALEKSFHGKLGASVQLTYNKNFRRAFQFLGIKTRFVAMNDAAALDRITEEEESELFDIDIVEGKVVLVKRPLPLFSAFLLEPIQGEGGINCVDAEFGRAIRRFCNRHSCPLIIDEIQSGMGRSGRFLASAQIGLRGDYYAFSKALGGSLAKLSALMVRKDMYEKDFGLIHSSTFAEDDFSAGIALKTLEILERDDGALYRQIEARGKEIEEGLHSLCRKYPDILDGVLGRGLFVGLVFRELEESSSQIIRTNVYAETLGYFVSGYMLRAEGIRLAPTGSAPNVLRLEPSAHIESGEIQRLIGALDRLCAILRHGDTMHLVFPLTKPDREIPRSEVITFHHPEPANPRPLAANGSHKNGITRPIRKVAFVNHLINPELLRKVEPSLADMSDAELRQFVLNSAALKKSAPLGPVRIRSRLGNAVDFWLYPLFVASEQMSGWLNSGDLEEIRDDIDERIRSAQEDGCELAGLGMYNSIVTNNCMSLAIPEMGLTSGNALTVAMSVEALDKAITERGMRYEDINLAIVGAAGNIASTYASILAERLSRITLIGSGRDGSRARLLKTVYGIYENAYDTLVNGIEPPAGLVARLLDEPLVQDWLRDGAPARDIGKLLHESLVERYGRDPYVVIATDTSAVADADAVLCAANAAEPFINAHEFRQGAIICDVAVPHNVNERSLDERPDLLYFQGGIVATPNGESLHPTVRAYLDAGQLYACMAETAILGLSEHRGHYSYGAITVQQVREIASLARLHGFGLAEFKRGDSL